MLSLSIIIYIGNILYIHIQQIIIAWKLNMIYYTSCITVGWDSRNLISFLYFHNPYKLLVKLYNRTILNKNVYILYICCADFLWRLLFMIFIETLLIKKKKNSALNFMYLSSFNFWKGTSYTPPLLFPVHFYIFYSMYFKKNNYYYLYFQTIAIEVIELYRGFSYSQFINEF